MNDRLTKALWELYDSARLPQPKKDYTKHLVNLLTNEPREHRVTRSNDE